MASASDLDAAPETSKLSSEELTSSLTASPGIWGSLKQKVFGTGSHPVPLSDSGSDDEASVSGSESKRRRSLAGKHRTCAQQVGLSECPPG